MSHEITIRDDGRAEMAFRAGTDFPWHFQETNPAQVPADATMDQWVHAAGMEWTVEAAPVRFEAQGEMRAFDHHVVLHRSDTLAPLGVVTENYNVINPRECIEFFDDLVQSVGLTLDTAGTLFGGKRFWALAKIGEECIIDNRDPMKGYLLLTSSADGTRATQARFTSVRVVCKNTLSLSDSKDGSSEIKITHRSEWKPDVVKERLGVAPASFQDFMVRMRRLADVRLTDDMAQAQVRKLLGKAEDKKDSRIFGRVMDLFRGLASGADAPGFSGTAWGLLNSVTEAMDHGSRAASDSHRLYSALMGPADKVKSKARDQLLELVD
jgi:phage/plasmid-like protein (TIGR03299 family)